MGVIIPVLVALSGLACGYIFSWQVCLALGVVVLAISGISLYQTRNAEIGALIGVAAMAFAVLFTAPMLIMVGLMAGLTLHVDLSWLLRSQP